MRRVELVSALALAATVVATSAIAAPPAYTIVDLGTVQPGDSASQGMRISPNGTATGRSVGSPTQAFVWTQAGGTVGLPNLASPARAFSVGNGVNNAGVVVGTGSTTAFGSSPLPLIWQGGSVGVLPLPAGQTMGRANDVNSLNVAVGSVGSGSLEFASLYKDGQGLVITQVTADNQFMRTAYGVNDSGLVVGIGVDPAAAAVNVGMIYDSVTGIATTVGALPGRNGAICFDVSNAGHVVGSSMLNQGSGSPFVWTAAGGMTEIPLPAGASSGIARGVNDDGWVVGIASSAFAVPFLYDGVSTYALSDLLPAGSGWDLATTTSASAMGISDTGIIVGTGTFEGQIRAYAMIPVPTPGAASVLAIAGLAAARRRR